MFACVRVCVCGDAWGGGAPCNRSRQVLKDSYGVISDGDGKYLEATYCQWLVLGKCVCVCLFGGVFILFCVCFVSMYVSIFVCVFVYVCFFCFFPVCVCVCTCFCF